MTIGTKLTDLQSNFNFEIFNCPLKREILFEIRMRNFAETLDFPKFPGRHAPCTPSRWAGASPSVTAKFVYHATGRRGSGDKTLGTRLPLIG